MKIKWDKEENYGERLTFIPEENEPLLRSCGECNLAHKNLVKSNCLFNCIECGQYYGYGYYFSKFKNEKDAYEKLSKVCMVIQ